MTPFVYRERVRFRDLDALGHVNNAVFLTYMESARTAFLVERGLASGLDDLRIIVARVEADFRSQAGWGETIEIAVRPGTLGRPRRRRRPKRAGRLRLRDRRDNCTSHRVA